MCNECQRGHFFTMLWLITVADDSFHGAECIIAGLPGQKCPGDRQDPEDKTTKASRAILGTRLSAYEEGVRAANKNPRGTIKGVAMAYFHILLRELRIYLDIVV